MKFLSTLAAAIFFCGVSSAAHAGVVQFSFNVGDATLEFEDNVDQFILIDSAMMESRFDTLEEFVEGIAFFFGGTQAADGTFNAVNIANGAVPNNIRTNDSGRVTIAGRSVGGRFQFDFDDLMVAEIVEQGYRDLFEQIAGAGALAIGDQPAPIPVPGAIPLLVTGVAGLAFARRRRPVAIAAA